MNHLSGNAFSVLVIAITSFFSLSSAQSALCQTSTFTPAEEDVVLLRTLAEKYERNYRLGIATLPPNNKKDFEEVYKLRWDNIKAKFDNKEIYTSPAAQSYLDALVAEIVKANPLLKGHAFHAYFSRSGAPNASYIGEGIILFNMGLFHRLDNESQAAFVLSHEIAHFYLQHSENQIKNYVATVNSADLQKELRKIKTTEYRKRAQLESLVKDLTFDTRRHGREHEREADSMALVLMRNTKFDIHEALTTLALLDTIDTDTLDIAACLQKQFNAKDYPFQKRWIAKETGLLGGHAELKQDEPLADSLKTHPDCQSRIKTLGPIIAANRGATATKDVVDKSMFEELRNTFRYEIIDYAYTADNYGRSLYHALELLETKPADPYLVAQTGRILNGLFAAQKAHTLSKVVDLPSPYFPSNYNMLLQFIQNLYLENFASISYHYLKQYNPALKSYQPFRNAYSASIQIAHQ